MFLYSKLLGGDKACLFGKIEERIKLDFCRNVQCSNQVQSYETFCRDCLINLKKNTGQICPISTNTSNRVHSVDEYIYPCLNVDCQFNTYIKDSFCDSCKLNLFEDIIKIKSKNHTCCSFLCNNPVMQDCKYCLDCFTRSPDRILYCDTTGILKKLSRDHGICIKCSNVATIGDFCNACYTKENNKQKLETSCQQVENKLCSRCNKNFAIVHNLCKRCYLVVSITNENTK